MNFLLRPRIFLFFFSSSCKEEIGLFEGGFEAGEWKFFKNAPGSKSSHLHKMKHHKYSNTSRLGLSLSEKESTDPSNASETARYLQYFKDLNIDAFLLLPTFCMYFLLLCNLTTWKLSGTRHTLHLWRNVFDYSIQRCFETNAVATANK